jgi:alkanesulfonate monooxygenase SsuD/methylene tetrahydromethanopterin reductase-like flavin-dependent oxidoreductase (luciferase family)
MRFGLLQSGHSPPGSYNYYYRYKDLVDEAIQAERMGFDFWGTTETHFGTVATVSAPEAFFPYLAAKTSRIRFRALVTLLPFAFNHPIRVAEQIATLDILSDGRADLGVGRGNTIEEIEGFGISFDDTRSQTWEALEIIEKALTLEEFEHHGELLDLPRRRLVPKPLQTPHPPIYMAASGLPTCRAAGELGVGAMMFDLWVGWDYFQQQIDAYKTGLAAANPLCGQVNSTLSVLSLSAYCASTWEEAKEEAGGWMMRQHRNVTAGHTALAKRSPDYGYMGKMADLEKHVGDLDFIKENSPTGLIGTPDDFIERIQKLEKMGVDEVILLIDSVGHEKIMKSIDLIGRYVIPEFKSPQSIFRGDPVRDAPLPEPVVR